MNESNGKKIKEMNLAELQKIIFQNAKDKGFWDQKKGFEERTRILQTGPMGRLDLKRPIPETLVLIHSEVSEALEAYRKKDFRGFKEELADVAIRLFDACEGYQIDLAAEVERKHKYNLKRAHMHGGKVI